MVNYVAPLMTPDRYKTYQVTAPVKTHFRPANSCEEVDCDAWRNGWKTTLDPSTEAGQYHIHILKTDGKHYKYTVEKLPTGLVEFTFEAGQNCFKLQSHRVRLERPQRYFVRDGDYRQLGHPTELRVDQWQEDFAIHQDRVKTRLERG